METFTGVRIGARGACAVCQTDVDSALQWTTVLC